jgi:hypothetical protein
MQKKRLEKKLREIRKNFGKDSSAIAIIGIPPKGEIDILEITKAKKSIKSTTKNVECKQQESFNPNMRYIG